MQIKIDDLEAQIDDLKTQVSMVVQDRDRAFEAGKQLEHMHKRNAEATEAHYKKQLDKLMERHQADGKETVKVVFEQSKKRYEELLQKLHSTDDPDVKEEVITESFFEYERKLWHANNDLKSLRTIVDVKMADKEAEVADKIENLQSNLEILRMQIRERGEEPHV